MTAPVIAVLDNDPFFLSLMHDLLTDEGYTPLLWHASEWARAHALLRRLRPHLVILDLWMEGRDDGWAFLKRLWGDAKTTHIPTVIVTGEPQSLPVQADVLHALHLPGGAQAVRPARPAGCDLGGARSLPDAVGSQPAPACYPVC